MRTIPRELLRHGTLSVDNTGRMVVISSEGPELTTTIGLSRVEARSLAHAILAETEERAAETREGIRHALMHLDFPKELDDGIVDYD